MTRAMRTAGVLAAVALLTSGCGLLTDGLRTVELPGGADLGDAPYTVSAEFSDVVDLVPQSLVMVDDVPVGTVRSITVGPDWTAMVAMAVNGDVTLPANATARVRTTSLLGEKFVELLAPEDPQGTLTDGATIPLERSGRAAEVEEVLGSLSLLLNGGGVEQIRTIATELNTALSGNEPEVRALLDDVDTLVGALDDRKGEIVRALDEINRLGSTLADRRGQIEIALTDIEPGLTELENQRGQLVDMLQSLDRLSVVGTDVINRSQEDVVADLELLRPTLQKLAESGSDLADSLEVFVSVPFTDSAADTFAGDYSNLYLTLDLDLGTILSNLANSNQPLLGPDGPLSGLPPTAQLLGPLVGPTGLLPLQEDLPLLGGEGGLLSGPEPSTPAPTPAPGDDSAEDDDDGGLLGRLFGGN